MRYSNHVRAANGFYGWFGWLQTNSSKSPAFCKCGPTGYREEKIDAVTVGLSEKVKNAFNALVPILNSCTEGVATGQTSYCTAQAALVMEIRNILISQNKDVSQTLLSFEGGLYAEEADIASIFAGFGANTTYQGYTITYSPPTATTSASISFKKGADVVVVKYDSNFSIGPIFDSNTGNILGLTSNGLKGRIWFVTPAGRDL